MSILNGTHDIYISTMFNTSQIRINLDNYITTNINHSTTNYSTSPLITTATLAIPLNQSSSLCPYTFKLFIYPFEHLLPSFQIAEQARHNQTYHIRPGHIYEQFSLEYIIYDYFSQFCGRTMNPDEADYFYIPMMRDVEFRYTYDNKPHNSHNNNKNNKNNGKKRLPSYTEQIFIDILEQNNYNKWLSYTNYTTKYWQRYNGADHILIMPAPLTDFRHEIPVYSYIHYKIHLYRPIFLVLEYSLSFIRHYPICTTYKNIIMPYPNTDYQLLNGRKYKVKLHMYRHYLLYYWGGTHGECIQIRKALGQMMINAVNNIQLAYNITPPHILTKSARENGFRASVFCPIPVGDSPSSKRMYDVMFYGCIPVILSDELVYAYSNTTGGVLDHTSYTIQFSQNIVQLTTPQILKRYKNVPLVFGGVLPVSKRSLYSILQHSYTRYGEYVRVKGQNYDGYVNPLVQVLRAIPEEDIRYLQEGVRRAGE